MSYDGVGGSWVKSGLHYARVGDKMRHQNRKRLLDQAKRRTSSSTFVSPQVGEKGSLPFHHCSPQQDLEVTHGKHMSKHH